MRLLPRVNQYDIGVGRIHVLHFWGLNALKKGGMENLGLPAIYKDLEPSFYKKLDEMNYPTP